MSRLWQFLRLAAAVILAVVWTAYGIVEWFFEHALFWLLLAFLLMTITYFGIYVAVEPEHPWLPFNLFDEP